MSAETAAHEAGSLRPPFISPRDTGRWAVGLLIATIGVSWLAVGIDLSNLWLMTRAAQGGSVDPALREAQLATQDWLRGAQGLLLFATGIAFIAWLYQTRVNLRALGVRRPTYGRQWCIWGFLVPLVNLFRPYQVIREIWRASSPASLDAFQWRSLRVPPLLGLWWAVAVACAGLRVLATVTGLGAGLNLQKLQLSVGMVTLSDLLAGVAAGLACFVVMRLSDIQEAKWELQKAA